MKIKQLLEEIEKIERGLEKTEKVRYNKDIKNQLKEGFDDFDWSDIELKPTDLPEWVQHELNSHIPSEVKDGDIVPRYVGDFIYDIKYNKKSALDYVVIYIKRIKGTKPNGNK